MVQLIKLVNSKKLVKSQMNHIGIRQKMSSINNETDQFNPIFKTLLKSYNHKSGNIYIYRNNVIIILLVAPQLMRWGLPTSHSDTP